MYHIVIYWQGEKREYLLTYGDDVRWLDALPRAHKAKGGKGVVGLQGFDTMSRAIESGESWVSRSPNAGA